MKRLALFCIPLILLVCLAASDGSSWLRIRLYDVPCVAYAAGAEVSGKAGDLMTKRYDSVTLTLTEGQWTDALELLCPTYRFRYTVEGMEITDGYSPALSDNVKLRGREFNFQVAIKGSVVLLGLPVLAGGY